MSGFADLVTQAQPALLAGGVVASGSAGRTWSWRFYDILDSAGDPIDLTSVIGEFKIVDSPGGTVILWLDFTGGLGEFTIGADESFTDGLFTADTNGVGNGQKCYWYGTLDDGTDSVQVWMVDNSNFLIRRGA